MPAGGIVNGTAPYPSDTPPSAVAGVGKPGALPSLPDPRTLHLADYLTLSKLHIPTSVDWTLKKTTPWGMMANWTLRDCACAGAGHMIECWTANGLGETLIDDAAVIEAYSAVAGYDPKTGANDKGCKFTAVLKLWRSVGIGGHRIKAFTAVKYTKPDMVRATVYLFGGLYGGLALPKSIDGQEIWTVMPGGLVGDNARNSLGGHCVPILAYDDEHLTCITYGQPKRMTWEFWAAYATECYAIITDDFLAAGKTPLGFDLAALEVDLLRVSREKAVLEKALVANPVATVTLGALEIMKSDLGTMTWTDAVAACAAVGDGWHLPDQTELDVLYKNKHEIGGFSADHLATYWSSTPHGFVLSDHSDDGFRYYQIFDDGGQYADDMTKSHHVRAVRTVSTAS